jgi:hypothetical protein
MVVKIKQKDGTQQTQLTPEQRRYVVRALAYFKPLGEVVRMLQEEFGVTVSKQTIIRYNPDSDSTAAGQSLTPQLKKYFHEQRRRAVDDLEDRPLAHAGVQLDRLNLEYEEAREAKDRKAVIKIIGEARKIMSDMEEYLAPGDEQ